MLLAQILPVSSLVAPCDPGAAPGTYATIHWDGTLAGAAERHLEVEPLCFLEMIDHLQKIARLRIAAGTQHAHQALGRPFGPAAQLVEPDGCVDIVAQDRLSGVDIPIQQALDAFPQKLAPGFPADWRRALVLFP